MSTVTPNLGLFKYNTSTDANSAFNINKALNNNWDIIDEVLAGGGGSSRNIGEIVASSLPLVDAGLHLLDGALINGAGIYSDFVTYIAGLYGDGTDVPDYFCSEVDWQDSVTSYGVCGKFVYNSTNNTVRLPKITGMIEGTTDVTALGDLVEAGLPNIIGSIGGGYNYVFNNGTGALQSANKGTTSNVNISGSDNINNGMTFDASRSSSIYGNSSTVQPQTIKAFYYIVIATSTKTSIQVDIDEIATDLNGKADKADFEEVQCVVETYVNGSSWYRIYSDGWCEQGVYKSWGDTGSYTFLKPYKDINWILVSNGDGGDATSNMGVTNRTATGFSYNNSNTSHVGSIYVCGYTDIYGYISGD